MDTHTHKHNAFRCYNNKKIPSNIITFNTLAKMKHLLIWAASRTFWVDFEQYVGRTLFAGPGNPALLPEVLKCSGTDLDPWPKGLTMAE